MKKGHIVRCTTTNIMYRINDIGTLEKRFDLTIWSTSSISVTAFACLEFTYVDTLGVNLSLKIDEASDLEGHRLVCPVDDIKKATDMIKQDMAQHDFHEGKIDKKVISKMFFDKYMGDKFKD